MGAAEVAKPTLTPREYLLRIPGDRPVCITRRDNHRSLLPDGAWVACRGEMYVTTCDAAWGYANEPGSWVWVYKVGTRFPTAEMAAAAALRAVEVELTDERKAANSGRKKASV